MGTGGAAKKQTNQMIQQSYNDSQAGAKAFNAIAQPQQQGAVNAANNIQQTDFNLLNKVGQNAGWVDPSLRQQYLNSLSKGSSGPNMSGYDPVKSLYTEFSGPNGGVDVGAIRGAEAGMKNLATTGGWSQADRDAQNKVISGYNDMAQTGGLDATAMNNMRGGGVFADFQKNGGYTDAQQSDFRARANSTLPAYYDAVRQGQNRMASIQGGNAASSAAMAARLARDQSAGMRAQSLDTENTLANNIRTGQQWGATGGATAENALQSLRTSNMLSGLGGAASTRQNMLGNIASNQQAGSQGWTQGELGIGNLVQQGRMYGTSGLDSLAGKMASASQSGQGDETAGLKWLANFEAGNTMDAAGGMTQLYNSTPGEVNMWNNTLLANRGLQGNQANQSIGNNMQNNPQRDWLQTLQGVAGVAGGVGGAITGFGALGGAAGAARPGNVSASQYTPRPGSW